MQASYDQIRALDSEVLVISFDSPEQVNVYCQSNDFPFPVLSDPERNSYQTLGIHRTSWKTMLKLDVMGRYLKLMICGWLPPSKIKMSDVYQLGGDVIVDAQCRLIYQFRSHDPSRRPAVCGLIEALRKIGI
ncbi:MAG: AhpC/TSA family protein [Planctomycetes bacterium]|nr:AhpC/TSA family protein [Planctomycetota bacterium]